MRSILEEFAYGKLMPEARFFNRDLEFGKVMEYVSRNEEKLLAKLNGDNNALFQKHIDSQGEVNRLTAVKNLVYGYKLGFLMTAEAFLQSGELISGEEEGW